MKANLYTDRQDKKCIKAASGKSKAEICACMDGKWLRVGNLIRDDRVEAKNICLIIPRALSLCIQQKMTIQRSFTLRMRHVFYSFTDEPRVIKF